MLKTINKKLKRLLLLALSTTILICWGLPLLPYWNQPARSQIPSESPVSQSTDPTLEPQETPAHSPTQASPDDLPAEAAIEETVEESFSDDAESSLDLDLTVPANRKTAFVKADSFYREGDRASAEELYRQLKPEFSENAFLDVPDPIYEADELDPDNLDYWSQALAAIEAKDEELAIPPLKQLVERQPEFIPGQVKLAEMLMEEDEEDEALAILEQAVTLYPYSAELVMAHVLALSEEKEHLEASIAAREFAFVNPDHPQVNEFNELSEKAHKRFRRSIRRKGILGGLANIATGILTGNLRLDPESVVKTIEIARVMAGNESEFGDKLAEHYRQRLPLLDTSDENIKAVSDYVTQLGLELGQLMGRDFDYEFYIVRDNAVNAFALPGGKIFVNTGAIRAANSQAELAGLLAHEIAHSVLSHGTQSFFRQNILSQLGDEVPFGDFAASLLGLHFSRQQERQADLLGSRVLATSGYAADGLRNFMEKLHQATQSEPLEYLSSHPASDSRIKYLEALIQRNGYNRYAFEGVDKHSEMVEKLA